MGAQPQSPQSGPPHCATLPARKRPRLVTDSLCDLGQGNFCLKPQSFHLGNGTDPCLAKLTGLQ